jgi:hypothetical protein
MTSLDPIVPVNAKILTLLSCALLAAGTMANAQSPDSTPSSATRNGAPLAAAARAVAVTAARAPELDGRDTDDVWATAPAITAFRVFDPVENGDPHQRTEARVAFDARNLYVFVRAFDTHPDSIVGILSRRDVRTQSDQIKVMVDSYHDRRTGYEFAVNPVGVKRDYYLYDDGVEDGSWDAVWEVATAVDSLGWTAEFRIPLSQLRFPARDEHTFGLMITRDIARSSERISWPTFLISRQGIASQFGELAGLRGLGSPRRLELAPYALTRNVSTREASGFGRGQRQSFGADAKYGITSNLTLDLTVNPDFGQIEADPAQLNLTAFESFFEERRPFFLEGTGILRSGGDRLFYSRRIGRAPQLGGLVEDPTAELPGSSTILGAAKLTGRLKRGTSVGALAAVTEDEQVLGTLIEPRTTYGVARVSQDLRGGESGVGVMLTQMHRDLASSEAELLLRGDAIAGGIDWRHRWGKGTYSLRGSLEASRVSGSRSAIARTQRSGVHYFQRPDDDLEYDTTLTSLSGTALTARFERTKGVMNVFSGYDRFSSGYETNDAGFLSRADLQRAFTEVLFRSRQPRYFWRTATATLYTDHRWTADGMSLGHMIDGWFDVQFNSQRRFFAEYWYDQWGGTMCDRCSFGGPAVRQSPRHNLLINLFEDQRKRVSPVFAAFAYVGDAGHSSLWRVRPLIRLRPSSNITAEVGTRYERNRDDDQWLANVTADGRTRYLFASLDQQTLSFSARLDYTIRPTLSFQVYAEPFVTAGSYTNVRELADARSPRYQARYQPYSSDAPVGDFNFKQLRTNTVLRWEYRPGSTVFVVWSQGRDQDDRDVGRFSASRDYGNLFSARPDNVFLIKASYWLGL